MCLRVDFILIEVPLAHRRVKVVVFVHHCIFPSFLFLKSVTLVTCTVSGGNIEPGGPNEVVCKSKSLYIGPNEVVPVRRDYKCTACLLLNGHFKARLHLQAPEPDCCCSYSQLTQRRFSIAGHSCEMSNYSKICKYF